MGDYNPHAPVIVGNEWVGIRDEATQFSPAVDVVELGHTFRTASAYTLQDGRFYVDEMPANAAGETYFIALYPKDREADTGPIRRVVIPAESAFVTGATLSGGTAIQAIFTPELVNYVLLDTDNAISQVTAGFNTAQYTVLTDKRIVAVNLLYAAHRFFNTEERDNGPFIYLANATYPFGSENIIYDRGNNIAEGGSLAGDEVLKVRFGDVCRLWQSPVTEEMQPWTYTDLQRFDASSGSRLYATIATGSSFGAPAGGICYVWYMALEVLFCEETRSIVGGLRRGISSSELVYGANAVRLRSVSARALNPQLAAGDWTVTLAAADQGGAESDFSGYPDLNALRELYALPTHEGVKVNITEAVGETFTRESVNILTQLSVHATGGAPLTEVHSYGRIAPGLVYGSTTVSQDVYDDTVAGGTTFDQLRFYARRWGDTTASLEVTGTGDLAGVSASITPDDFDALSEIVDGWKEVTLTLSPAATLGGLASPGLLWRATGETAGSRWEVLGVRAPAASGIPGNLYNEVPSAQRLSSTTYQPSGGTTHRMTWMPPPTNVSGADVAADVVFLLSQSPPTITGLTVQTLSQAVTGIGEGCAGTPCCIPTEIFYHRVTWSAAAGTVSGDYLGAIELQRSDDVTEWQTIMSASSPGVTGFNDYEARAGQVSQYRIRATNLYDFAGAWSDAASGTLTSPGVTVQCDDDDTAAGTLIFTSNADQSGARNLAYVMQFDRSVEESFAFPEAATSQMRRRYGRDYFTAFRPTERGGEQFSRVILVQAAAGALPNMANIRSLRDLAWADLPYVCVRDERGNRWFANVVVPDVNISHRSSYYARVDIAEVTDTSCEVDP